MMTILIATAFRRVKGHDHKSKENETMLKKQKNADVVDNN